MLMVDLINRRIHLETLLQRQCSIQKLPYCIMLYDIVIMSFAGAVNDFAYAQPQYYTSMANSFQRIAMAIQSTM